MRLKSVIPAGATATRCLRVHSAVGSDARHVSESIGFIAQLARIEQNEHRARGIQRYHPHDEATVELPGDEAFRRLIARYSRRDSPIGR